MVSIRDISVTSNIFKHLVRAYVEPRYIGHLQDKYKWNNSVVSIISWKSLALAIERIDRGVLLTKICHALLPTNQKLKKQHYTHNDQCPLCRQSESFNHLIQCQHQSQTQWRCGFITKLRTKSGTVISDYGTPVRPLFTKFSPLFFSYN